MTKSRIALLVSLMFAAPAAVIALEQSASVDAAQPPESTEIQAATTESATPAEPAVVAVEVTQTEIVAVAEPSHAAQPSAHAMPVEMWTNNSFPKNAGPEDWDRPLLAAQSAYFDRQHQQRGQLIARHDAFPGAAYEYSLPLPATVAYFDRTEQQRFASAQSAPARPEVQSRSSDEVAKAGSSEVALADTSAIR